MAVFYKDIELEGLDKATKMYHSNAMRAMGLDNNEGTEYLDKLCEYKRADLPEARFDEINKLWSVVKMNYQICNGGIYQYFGNGYHNGWKSEDGETEIFDKDTQVEMLEELCAFAGQVFPDNVGENSKLMRITKFFESLTFEERVPQYGMIECDEDKEIWDDELEDWVENPDYEEPYEDIVDYEDEIQTDLVGFVADDFDDEYYQINEYLERVIEGYAQFLEKSIQKELGLGVDRIILEAQTRAAGNGDYTEEQLEALFNSENPKDRWEAAQQGYRLFDLMADDNEVVVEAARAKADELYRPNLGKE